MRCALSTAAGKDATLALHRARASGLEVSHAFNLYDGPSGRVRFHGTRRELLSAYADALGLELIQRATSSSEFEPAFLGVLDELVAREIEAVIFGNIHLADVREWYETRTTGRRLHHVEPLWGDPPGTLARELVALGYRATIVSVDLAQARAEWLGQELTEPLIETMERHGIDACGEKGEYHTFVWDGPEFSAPVQCRIGERVEMEGHALVDLALAG